MLQDVATEISAASSSVSLTAMFPSYLPAAVDACSRRAGVVFSPAEYKCLHMDEAAPFLQV